MKYAVAKNTAAIRLVAVLCMLLLGDLRYMIRKHEPPEAATSRCNQVMMAHSSCSDQVGLLNGLLVVVCRGAQE